MNIRRGSVALLCGLMLVGGTWLTGADPAPKKGSDPAKSKTESKAESKGAKEKDEDASALKGKLPNHFGKLDLSDEQRQTIYKIQDKYDGEINRLEAKLKELKGTRQKEVEGVLTKEQQARLKLLKDGGKTGAAKSAGKPKGTKPESK